MLRRNIVIKFLIVLALFAVIFQPFQIFVPAAYAADGSTCLSWTDFSLAACVEGTLKIVGSLILQFFAWLLWFCAVVFGQAINITIIRLSDIVRNTEAISVGWTVARDVANLFFIFILLYIAITTILRAASANTKGLLVKVIVVALLVNFSMFFTKVIIDTSNLFTISFFNAITEDAQKHLAAKKSAGNSTIDWANELDGGISALLVDSVELTSVFKVPEKNSGAIESTAALAGNVNGILITTIAGSVMMVILGVVLFAGAFLLVLRLVAYCLLLVFAPIAFVGMILPKTKGMISDKWWDILINQSIFAPAFMLFLLISIKIIVGLKNSGVIPQTTVSSVKGFADLFQTMHAGSASLIINYVIIISFIVIALTASKQLGVAGASGAMSFAKGVNKRFGTSLAKRGGGAMLRGTVGRAGLALDNTMSKTPHGNAWYGRALRSMTTGAAAKAKFGTKMDAKKAAEERGKIEKAKGDAGGRYMAKTEERLRTKADSVYRTARNSDSAIRTHTSALRNARSLRTEAEAKLEKLRNQKSLMGTQTQEDRDKIAAQERIVEQYRQAESQAQQAISQREGEIKRSDAVAKHRSALASHLQKERKVTNYEAPKPERGVWNKTKYYMTGGRALRNFVTGGSIETKKQTRASLRDIRRRMRGGALVMENGQAVRKGRNMSAKAAADASVKARREKEKEDKIKDNIAKLGDVDVDNLSGGTPGPKPKEGESSK